LGIIQADFSAVFEAQPDVAWRSAATDNGLDLALVGTDVRKCGPVETLPRQFIRGIGLHEEKSNVKE
jgi:hypothetical protein